MPSAAAESEDSAERGTKKIIDNYITLKEVYEAFQLIIKSYEPILAHHKFNEKFHSYLHRDEKVSSGSKEHDNMFVEECRARLAKDDIKPFLEFFIKEVETKRVDVDQYLNNETQSDSEIIKFM